MASSLFCRSAGLYRDNSTASSASATAANKQQQLLRTRNCPPSPSPSPSPSPHFNDFLGYAPLALSSSSSPASDLSSLRSVFQGPDPRFHDPLHPFDNNSERSSSFSSFMSSISDDNEEDGDEAESSIFDSSSESPSSALSSSSSTTPPPSSSSSSLSSSSSFPPEQQSGPLDTIESLASALPIKRGLSCYFSGKSQSFSCLSAISNVADLAKPEDPFAKKRRMSANMAKKQNRSHPSRCGSSGAISKRSASHSSIGINHSQTKSSRYHHHHHHHYLKPLPSSKCFSVSELQDAAAAY